MNDLGKQLKRFALVKSKTGNVVGAIKDLEIAIGLAEHRIRELEAERHPGIGESEVAAMANSLADYYGTAGGIFQKSGRDYYEKAKEYYKKGFRYENDYKLDNTYNRVNLVVVALLLDPAGLPKWSAEIKEGIEVLSQQTQGSRSSEWWAWADLALLLTLDGDIEVARNAYREFKGTGARATNFDSHLAVLKRLRDAIDNSECRERLNTMINELKANKPSD